MALRQCGADLPHLAVRTGGCDLRQALAARGVDMAQAQARVQALSDDEVAALANQMDQAPAGGDILGVAFTIFIILLITDILGLTKVFPFTRSVR